MIRTRSYANRRQHRLAAALILGLLMLASPDAPAAQLFVALNGDDANPGTEAQPFATLERARDEVRRLKADGSKPAEGITVELRGGVYELARPFELTEEDGGTEAAPIVYRSRPGESVRLVGGRVVTGWKPVTDPAALARIDESAREHVRWVDLKALGIDDLGEVAASGKRLELFFQDQRMTLARWPNDGFVQIVDVNGPTEVDVRGTKGRVEGIFTYEGDRPKRWTAEKDPWAHGYWFWDWSDQRQPIASIDPETHRITLKPPHHGYGYRKGQWFYAFNLLSELDQPGEWQLDRETGVLYLWPPSPIDEGQAVVSVLPTLVRMRNASYVTLRGLGLEACRDNAVEIHGGRGVRVAACLIRNGGRNAVVMTGEDHGVVGCDISEMGAGGIVMRGGDRQTLKPAGLFAENNHIHHYGRWERMYQPGVQMGGVGNRVVHNLIDNAPHMAIQFGGNDHLIEFNEIHSVCYESNDAGAIYAGRNWSMRGTRIRHNYLHDIQGFENRGCVGVYLDDQFSGTEIFGNVFCEVTRAAMIGGGRDCVIENNIFVDCVPATHVDARGLGWAADGFDRMEQSLKAMPYEQPPWSERYPKLTTILDDEPMAPKGNLIARNILVGGRWGDFEDRAKPMVTFQDNLLDQDPLFVDAANHDFRLRDDSPALKLGFQPIPIERIGLYQDELRASWPVHHAVRDEGAESKAR